jgi:peptidoglycan/xylan/chitin deacetylase (PgdA/CDA1 family)
VTMFVTNETLSGTGNYPVIEAIFRFAEQQSLRLEIASHGSRHEDMSNDDPREAGKKIVGSLREFSDKGFPVCGFRAPFLSIEDNYQDILSSLKVDNGGLRYDSSICFESGLMTSFFHILVRRKSPHKVGTLWELPVSALDDYHILRKRGKGEPLAFLYWVVALNIWLLRLNYFLLLLHPHTIGKHLALLDRLLSYCVGRFPEKNFVTCLQLVDELDALRMQYTLSDTDG